MNFLPNWFSLCPHNLEAASTLHIKGSSSPSAQETNLSSAPIVNALANPFGWNSKTYLKFTSLHLHYSTITLPITDQNWKQSRCLSVGDWLNKLWFIHDTEHYSAVKRNKLLIHATTWMNLYKIILNEKSQSPMVCVILFI